MSDQVRRRAANEWDERNRRCGGKGAGRMLAVIRKRRNLGISPAPRLGSGSVQQTQRAEWVNPTSLATANAASGRIGEPNEARRSDWSGTLMSHARPTMSLPIGSLAMAVSLPAGFTPLITTAGGALLPSPSCRTTFPAAIALTTVTAAAHKEQGATARPVADPWEKRRLDHHRLDFGAPPHHHNLDPR